MKCVIFLVLAVALVLVSSLPVHPVEDLSDTVPLIEHGVLEEIGSRTKRATCDGGSFSSKWFTPNHSLCALHCLAKRYKGGYCKNTICHCRN